MKIVHVQYAHVIDVGTKTNENVSDRGGREGEVIRVCLQHLSSQLGSRKFGEENIIITFNFVCTFKKD